MTNIGNADVPIRSNADRLAEKARGDSRLSESTALLLKSVNSLLELVGGGAYHFTTEQPLRCLFENFWFVLAILCGENRTPTLLPGRKTKADGPLLA